MIKNIIFDLGGIILNIDFERSANEFKKLGINNLDQLYSKATQDHLFIDLEKGKITPKIFRNKIKELSKLTLTDSDIDSAWNAILMDYPNKRLKLLQETKQNYRCFLLSNTNIIHYKSYQQQLREHHQIDGLESLFERAYFSHEMGMRKPDTEIFEEVIRKERLVAEETLFIDDSIQNIEAAQKLGIKVLFIDVNKNQDILEYFKNGKLINHGD